MPSDRASIAKRCLIVERHEWETGAAQRQLQFVLGPAHRFFGPGLVPRTITINLHSCSGVPSVRTITISRVYANGTRRTNSFPEMGAIPASFVFFQETGTADTYDVWWQVDRPVVAARYKGWSQGKNSQFGRGRLSTIVDGRVPRLIDRI